MKLYNGVSYELTRTGSIILLDGSYNGKGINVSLEDKSGLKMTVQVTRKSKDTVTKKKSDFIIPVREFELREDELELFIGGDDIRKENQAWFVIDYLTTVGRI